MKSKHDEKLKATRDTLVADLDKLYEGAGELIDILADAKGMMMEDGVQKYATHVPRLILSKSKSKSH